VVPILCVTADMSTCDSFAAAKEYSVKIAIFLSLYARSSLSIRRVDQSLA